jgi:hypothetical protein
LNPWFYPAETPFFGGEAKLPLEVPETAAQENKTAGEEIHGSKGNQPVLPLTREAL